MTQTLVHRRPWADMIVWHAKSLRDWFYLPKLKACKSRLDATDDLEKMLDQVVVEDGLGGKGRIFAYQNRWELGELAKIVRSIKPATVVEIGTARGGTLYTWSRLMQPGGLLVSIDMPGGGGSVRPPTLSVYRSFGSQHGIRVHTIRADSHAPATHAALRSILASRPIDFMFIDGDHSYEGVKADYQDYLTMMSPQGVMAFHDIAVPDQPGYCECQRFWNELSKLQPQRTQALIADRCPWGIGVLRLGQ